MGGLKKHMSRCNKIVNFSASDSAGDGPVVTPLNTGDTDHSPRPSVPAGVERTSVGYSGGGLTKSDGEEEECLKEPASPVF